MSDTSAADQCTLDARLIGRLQDVCPVKPSDSRSAHGHYAKAYEAKTVRPAPSVGLWEANPSPGGTGTSPSGEHRPDRQDKNSVGKRRLFRERRVGSRLSMSVIRNAVTL
jgi:hypothetical protein